MKRLGNRALWMALAWISCCVATLLLGDTSWNVVWEGFLQRLHGTDASWNALLDERLPRLLVLLCTGASLAVTGAVMQALFQNPLASPMVFGLSAGGSLAAIAVFILGWHLAYPFTLPIAAILGCLGALLTVFSLSKRHGTADNNSLILSGIALSTVLMAIQGAIMYALRNHWEFVSTFTEWEAGSSSDRSWLHVHLQLPLTLIGLWGCLYYRQELNLLTLGDEEAANLGVEVAQVRWRLFLCVCILTGGALAAMGLIAFFGLVLPHILRRLVGPDNRILIPGCVAVGGPVLVSLDLLLRLLHVQSISLGSVTALLGGIFFLTLLFNQQRGIVGVTSAERT